jgi:hypothetical protein
MSLSLFDLQREHYEIKSTNGSFTSKAAYKIPEFEVGFSSQFIEASGTTPGGFNTVTNKSYRFIIKNNNSIKSYNFSRTTPEVDKFFWSLPQPSWSYASASPFYNTITLNFNNGTITSKQMIQSFTLVDQEPDSVGTSTYNGSTWTTIVYSTKGLPMYYTGPWQDSIRCSHLRNNATGTNSNVSYFETWGHANNNMSHCRIYLKDSKIMNTTITTTKQWMQYLFAQNDAGTPVTFYWVSADPDTCTTDYMYEPIIIEQTISAKDPVFGKFVSSLLSNGEPLQVCGANNFSLSAIELNTSIPHKLKLKYLATR